MRILFYPALGERQVDELMPGIGVCLLFFVHDYRNNLLIHDFRLQAHTDFECFTILRQDDVPSALQVQNRKGECERHQAFFFFLPFDLTKISDFCIERD